MAETLSNLLIEQAETISAIDRALVNFKKLSKAAATLPKVRGRLEALESLWVSCRSLHVRLLQTATTDQKRTLTYFVNDDFLGAEDAYQDAADYMHEAIGKLTKPSSSANQSGDLSSRDISAAGPSQLSRIVIPKFNGKLTEWENFRGLFESLVNMNETLTNTQKLHYLKTSVAGDAAQLISNLQISDANYDAAWKLLTDEYDDAYALIHAHIHAIAEVPPMKSENSTELKKLRAVAASSIAALRGLGCPVEHWDDLLVYLLSQKLSPKTKNEWNLKRSTLSERPTYADLNEFLTIRTRGLTDLSSLASESASSGQRTAKSRNAVNNITPATCVECSESHPLYRCGTFLKRSCDQRFEIVKQHKLCHNCLKRGHYTGTCPSKVRCLHCRRSHHSLLHRNVAALATASNPALSAASNNAPPEQPPSGNASPAVSNVTVQSVQSPASAPLNVLLATAWVVLRTAEGRTTRVRALLDQGSTCSFITESLCQTLRTRRQRTNLLIRCFGDKYNGAARSCVAVTLSSCTGRGPSFPLVAYSYQRITSYAASRIQPVESWPHLHGLSLADPDPSSRHPIHLLIGADLYGSILQNDIRQGPVGTPTAQRTVFGWILSGPTGPSSPRPSAAEMHNCVAADGLDALLQEFWNDENVPSGPLPLTEEDQRCERHFVMSHRRTDQGRYIVRLPFKTGPPIDIGDSLAIASTLYAKLNHRLQRQPALAIQYHAFLEEYESLHHMERVAIDAPRSAAPVYIPHHAVVREGSSTTKLRVVFNASCRTANGTTLNDHLFVGPKLQQDLSSIILRWRQFRYVYTADIEKMYRQILVHRDDVDYQRILWQPPNSPCAQHYRLLTITYGTACAPYLALRVLKQLVHDEGDRFPEAVSVVENSIYVDDALFGADDRSHLIKIRDQLIALMSRGGFELRKWTSNASSLLQDIPRNRREMSDLSFTENDSLKVLGLSWLPREDAFKFNVSLCDTTVHSKRTILSMIARLFDPLGWAAPVTISAKILLQELWLAQVRWDDPIPDRLRTRWIQYCDELPHLEAVRIPRWIGVSPTDAGVEVHGFADASTRAYAAVAYLRVHRPSDEARVHLIAAKTKVAPVKTLSVPRLELNAVVLLSRLFRWIRASLKLVDVPFYGWTDSTVTLAWITQHPVKWRSYVANRVTEVQATLPSTCWRYVPSAENPADCASRGLSAADLPAFQLWWRGPPWLAKSSRMWPGLKEHPHSSLGSIQAEARTSVHQVAIIPEWDLPTRFSSWTTLIRVTAYVQRFVANIFKRRKSTPGMTGSLTVSELRKAERFWISTVQRTQFASERKTLLEHKPLPRSSTLRRLNPILGEDQLIRLGGRLENSALTYSERHPIILSDHHIVRLLIDKAHASTLHGGTQLVLRLLRQRFWVISARSLVQGHIRRCVTCVRHSAQTERQQMSNLPASRVTPSAPFTSVGVDYAGPMHLIARVARGQQTTKHYVAVFVCFATRAVHLECVEDYSTAAFLAAFQRFVSRRGLPTHVYSDNGTNFQGADRELQSALRTLTRDLHLREILANDGVTWHFIPPSAPHFGGLWEAGVKSFKFHLKRALGAHTLSRAEFATLLCKIEACLNSRPLSPLSADPADFAALTPGHFLIGRPLVSVPEASVVDLKESRLDRWQLVRRLQERIWRDWSHEYLHSLQQRSKWFASRPNVLVNELVLLKNNALPPSKWELGRITQTYPGQDGLTRVVTIRTAHGEFKRPITQICRLPIPFTQAP